MIRKSIFSTNTQSAVSNIPPVSIVGSNVSIGAGTITTLIGDESYDIDGTIDAYLWEQVSAHAGVTIVSPSSANTSILGLTTPETFYIFRLTVTDNDGAQHSADVTVYTSESGSSNVLMITSSIPDQFGSGTLDFINGEPYEVVDLLFTLSGALSGDSIDFSGANIGVLDSTHLVRTGSVTLLSNGTLSKNYSSTGTGFNCVIEITGRSSSEPIPATKTTQVVL